jgi:hypothetical protein
MIFFLPAWGEKSDFTKLSEIKSKPCVLKRSGREK